MSFSYTLQVPDEPASGTASATGILGVDTTQLAANPNPVEIPRATALLSMVAGGGGTVSPTEGDHEVETKVEVAVNAVADPNWHFVQWTATPGATLEDPDEPNTTVVVTDAATVTATFAVDAHTLTYTAGVNGMVEGDSPQMVEHGADGTSITAVPAACYTFVQWSDGVADNPRQDSTVLGDIMVTAQFAITEYTLTYSAGANGTVTGPTPQTVVCGGDGQTVTAEPNTGYHFSQWLLGAATYSTDPSLAVANVTGNMDLTAFFEINEYVVTFLAGAGGSLVGDTVQDVTHGGNSLPVTAVADTGYEFSRWDDGSTANPREFTNVQENVTTTAEFVAVVPQDPDGEFDLLFGSPANPEGRKIHDLTGPYSGAMGAYNVALDMNHDEKGTLTGMGTLGGSMPDGTMVNIPLTIKGKAKGKAGIISTKISLAGSNATSSAKVKQTLTLDAGNLEGAFSASIADDVGGKDKAQGTCDFPIPAGMDGTFLLTVDLDMDPKGKISGTGTLVLTNGREIDLVAKGKMKGGVTSLSLAGDKTEDPMFSAVKFKMTIETFSNGTGHILGLSGKAFGQSIKWP